MNPIWYVDSPNVSSPYSGPKERYALKGWIAYPKGTSVVNLRHAESSLAKRLELKVEPRADVGNTFPGMRAIGLSAECAYEHVCEHSHIDLLFAVDNVEYRICFPTKQGAEGSFENRAEKFSRLIPLLRCSRCTEGELEELEAGLRCRNCLAQFSKSAKLIDMSLTQLSSRVTDETSAQSANEYDPIALNIIHEYQNGLVLDYGSGIRRRYFDNVINYEIFPNDSVDLLGDGGRIALADSSVDAVLSLAVLEHVPNPFETAAELLRVLKPEGRLYVQVPFMFPEHGFPNHYYNMTQAGLKNLFGEKLSLNDIGVLSHGHPICTLSHLLREYFLGLPKPVAKRFKRMRIKNFLGPHSKHLHADYVTQLSDDAKRRIAGVNYLIGTKK